MTSFQGNVIKRLNDIDTAMVEPFTLDKAETLVDSARDLSNMVWEGFPRESRKLWARSSRDQVKEFQTEAEGIKDEYCEMTRSGAISSVQVQETPVDPKQRGEWRKTGHKLLKSAISSVRGHTSVKEESQNSLSEAIGIANSVRSAVDPAASEPLDVSVLEVIHDRLQDLNAIGTRTIEDQHHLVLFKKTMSSVLSCYRGSNDPAKMDFEVKEIAILLSDIVESLSHNYRGVIEDHVE